MTMDIIDPSHLDEKVNLHQPEFLPVSSEMVVDYNTIVKLMYFRKNAITIFSVHPLCIVSLNKPSMGHQSKSRFITSKFFIILGANIAIPVLAFHRIHSKFNLLFIFGIFCDLS